MKILTSKYLSKYTFSLRNALSPQKVYHEIRKSGSTVKIFLEIFKLYGNLYSDSVMVKAPLRYVTMHDSKLLNTLRH